MEDLYNRILNMGIERGYKNMTAICAAAGVKRATMTEYKKGRTLGLSLDTLVKFSNLYGVSVDEIMNGTWQGNMDREMRGYRMGREDGKKLSDQWMDEELKECLEVLRDRPDTRALLHASRDMTPEQVAKMAEFMRSMKGAENAD